MKTNRRGGQGFSLIELLVVVGIIGIMVAVAIPAIANYLKTYKIRGAAQQVAGELTRARTKAVGSNTNNGVLLVTGVGDKDNQYQVWLEDDPTHDPTKPSRPPIPIPTTDGGPGGTLMRLPAGIHFVAAAGANWAGRALRFDRLGRACAPTVSCQSADPNGTAPTTAYVNTAPAAPYSGNFTICLKQDSTPLTMAVVVQPGGAARIVRPDASQPCP